jgi:hypothetical protein
MIKNHRGTIRDMHHMVTGFTHIGGHNRIAEMNLILS